MPSTNPFDDKPINGHITGIAIMLLDETGSMSGIAETAKAGVNTYFDGLKESDDKDHIIAKLLTFSARLFARHNEAIIRDHFFGRVSTWTPKALDAYNPNGGTPLYDAIGAAIAAGDGYSALYGTRKVSIIIQTDGLENSSREFDHRRITDLIEKKQSEGWMFVFLGSDLRGARNVGLSMNIRASAAYASMDTTSVMRGMSMGTRTYFHEGAAVAEASMASQMANWNAEINPNAVRPPEADSSPKNAEDKAIVPPAFLTPDSPSTPSDSGSSGSEG